MERDNSMFDEVYDAYDDAPSGEPREDAAAGGPSPVFTPDPDLVTFSEGVVKAAEKKLRAARAKATAAHDAAADADDAAGVTEAKVADYEDDDNKAEWQKAAARRDHAKAQRAQARATTRATEADEAVAAAEDALERARAALEEALRTPAPEPEKPPVQRFASLEVFVDEYVVPNWVHKMGDNYAGRWCARWWEHAEAITRLEAVWEAFEVMRLEAPPSLSTWIRDHLDPHMRMLTGTHGVFYRCDPMKHIHELAPVWETEASPEGMFLVNAAAPVQGKRKTAEQAEQLVDEVVDDINEKTGEVL